MFVRTVQDVVGGDHIVHHVALGDLLRAELLRGREILAVVVAEMVVAHDRDGLDAGRHQEVHQHRLQLGLARLEVIAGNERTVVLRHLDHTGHERVLGRSVDVDAILSNSSHGEDRRGRNLRMVLLERALQIRHRRVDAFLHLGEPLRICRPQDDHLVHARLLLELANVPHDLLVLLVPRALDRVVRPVRLVGRNKVGVVDRGPWAQLRQPLVHLILQPDLQHLRPLHRLTDVERANVPPIDDDIVRVDHRHQLVHRDVHILAGGVRSEQHRRRLRDRAVPVRLLDALARAPFQAVLVRLERSGQRRTVVAAPADQHQPHARDISSGADIQLGSFRFHRVSAWAAAHHGGRLVLVVHLDVFVRVVDVRRKYLQL
uniref:Uncharacterized protein n=1 Tax=Anopheles quadriannulatus TaxID=34691 RepID=A0A182XT73_ANOQN